MSAARDMDAEHKAVESRIIERLPDGRIRCMDRFGNERVGEQVGRYAVAYDPDPDDIYRCNRCDAVIGEMSMAIHFLDPNDNPEYTSAGRAPDAATARVLADSASMHPVTDPAFLEWFCAMHDRDEWVPFHVWRRERAS